MQFWFSSRMERQEQPKRAAHLMTAYVVLINFSNHQFKSDGRRLSENPTKAMTRSCVPISFYLSFKNVVHKEHNHVPPVTVRLSQERCAGISTLVRFLLLLLYPCSVVTNQKTENGSEMFKTAIHSRDDFDITPDIYYPKNKD